MTLAKILSFWRIQQGYHQRKLLSLPMNDGCASLGRQVQVPGSLTSALTKMNEWGLVCNIQKTLNGKTLWVWNGKTFAWLVCFFWGRRRVMV